MDIWKSIRMDCIKMEEEHKVLKMLMWRVSRPKDLVPGYFIMSLRMLYMLQYRRIVLGMELGGRRWYIRLRKRWLLSGLYNCL